VKVHLIEPPKYTPTWEYDASSQENLGLEYLVSVARSRGHDVSVVSCPASGWKEGELLDGVMAAAPDIIGVSLPFSDGMQLCFSTITRIRDKVGSRVHITVGGRGATASPEEVLRCTPADSVVVGEGENTFGELLDRIDTGADWHQLPGLCCRGNGRAAAYRRRPLVRDLDALPLPSRDILLAMRQEGKPIEAVYVSASRGCPFNCSFCDIGMYYNGQKSWRGRSPKLVVDELGQLVEQFGSGPTYCFIDDNFMGVGRQGQKRAQLIAKEILERGLRIDLEIGCRPDEVDLDTMTLFREAGLRSVFLGVESGNQAALDRFHKGTTPEASERAVNTLTNLGICCDMGFIMFDPWQTLDEVEQNVEFLQRMRDAHGVIVHAAIVTSRLRLYPGSAAMQRYSADESGGQLGSVPPPAHDADAAYDYFLRDKRVAVIQLAVCVLADGLRMIATEAGRSAELPPEMGSSLLGYIRRLADGLERLEPLMSPERFERCLRDLMGPTAMADGTPKRSPTGVPEVESV
jgi:radical SAM superfamily enzyme YgiQ (UPF0313 family)